MPTLAKLAPRAITAIAIAVAAMATLTSCGGTTTADDASASGDQASDQTASDDQATPADGDQADPDDQGDDQDLDAPAGGDDQAATGDEAANEDNAPRTGGACGAVDAEPVEVSTSDGETLTADWYQPAQAIGSAVLLHMIPPANNRSNYPAEFIDALTARCIQVLNVDRRGAGGSSGDPVEAYTGPNGVLDAQGAVAFIAERGSGGDQHPIAVVGASNGTTTALDYVATGVDVATVVLLSPGDYTENQVTLPASGLPAVPALFAFPDSEAAWNLQARDHAQGRWEFEQYDGGGHGTRLFSSHPESVDRVASFIATGLTS